MSKSNDNNDNSYNDSPVYFHGIPINPKMNMDEGVDEVTRKIAPTMIMPSLGPLPTMPPTRNTGGGGRAMAPTIDTSPMKGPPSLGRYGFGLIQQPKPKQLKKDNICSSRFVWNLPSAPSLPEFHPLERTAVFVPNTMPSEIASRISSVLRERSIEAQYDNTKAKVKCTTAEGVDFRIRLYRGRGRYNHGIIVEVQRRFGTSLVFHADTESILGAAQEKFPPPPLPIPSLSALPPPLMKRNNNLPEATDDDDDDDDDYYDSSSSYAVASADSSLAMVAKMMKLPGFDSQYLGLQTLTPLVDSDKLSLSTAQGVATKLLQPENEVGIKVFRYIVHNQANGNNKNEVEGEKRKARGVFDDDDDDDDAMILRNMCLNILANSLRAYGKVPDFLLREPLRPALLQDLKDAEKHPNTALLSAKCLEYFAQGDHNHNHDTTELVEAFEIAQKVGEARHANLMRQARKCMIAIR